MAIDFKALMKRTDSILNDQGLYTQVTYIEETDNSETYDPITGKHDISSNKTYIFNAVLLPETEAKKSSGIKGDLNILALVRNISFYPLVDMDFVINDITWRVIDSKLSPQDTVYEISLGRK